MRPKDHMPATRFWFVVLASGALLLAACGGTETDKNTTSATSDATQPITPAKQMFDFGDAPDPLYPTNLKSGGARHKDITRAWLGRKVDAESSAAWQDDILAYTAGTNSTTGSLPPAP